MKFRIIRKNELYYPQYNLDGIWFYYTEIKGPFTSKVYYYTFEQAEDYIMAYIEQLNDTKYVVEKEYES